MATYTNDLRLKEITTGDEDGTWGTSTNTNLSLIADAFSLGTKNMALDTDETFTMPDATADGTRSLYLKITSAVALTATRTVTLGPNTVSKVWIIENATTGSQSIIIKQGTGATVTVATGTKVMVATNGAGAGAAVINASPSEVSGTIALILLATLAPTAAANVDFLSTFSATYDNYLITGNGINFSATDALRLRLAVSGTADSGSNYQNNGNGPGINASATSTSSNVSYNVNSSGLGCSFSILITNANSAVSFKNIVVSTNSNDTAAPSTSYIYMDQINTYFAANAVTGFRLFASGGSNFTATGTVRVYGYKNS